MTPDEAPASCHKWASRPRHTAAASFTLGIDAHIFNELYRPDMASLSFTTRAQHASHRFRSIRRRRHLYQPPARFRRAAPDEIRGGEFRHARRRICAMHTIWFKAWFRRMKLSLFQEDGSRMIFIEDTILDMNAVIKLLCFRAEEASCLFYLRKFWCTMITILFLALLIHKPAIVFWYCDFDNYQMKYWLLGSMNWLLEIRNWFALESVHKLLLHTFITKILMPCKVPIPRWRFTYFTRWVQ